MLHLLLYREQSKRGRTTFDASSRSSCYCILKNCLGIHRLQLGISKAGLLCSQSSFQ
jgi:hypothetical protein